MRRWSCSRPPPTDSPIAKFLSRRGPGLHHVTLEVDDIARALSELKTRGVRLIDDQPRPGAHGSLVAFIHPSSAQGVLVELTQAAAKAEEDLAGSRRGSGVAGDAVRFPGDHLAV